MNRFILLIAGFLVLTGLASGDVNCPGDYEKHLQGIATDDRDNIYWSFTTVLVKTDGQGKLLAQVNVPSHYGDLTWHDGKVFVAVNLGKFNKETGAAKSWVYVHDAETLALLSKHAVPEVVHGAGGMEWYNGRFFVVGGLPPTHITNYVYEYTDEFEFVCRHIIESGQTLKGIQTICRGQDGTWWFGCYGKPAVTLRTNDRFVFLERIEFNSSYGIARTKDDNVLLIGKDRLVGKRHVCSVVRTSVENLLPKKAGN